MPVLEPQWPDDYFELQEPPVDAAMELPFAPVAPLALEDPFGAEEGEFRVIRGGRWLVASTLCRSAARMMGTPEYRGFHIGFRVAYEEEPTQ